MSEIKHSCPKCKGLDVEISDELREEVALALAEFNMDFRRYESYAHYMEPADIALAVVVAHLKERSA